MRDVCGSVASTRRRCFALDAIGVSLFFDVMKLAIIIVTKRAHPSVDLESRT